MSEFWSIILYSGIVIISLVISIAPQITYADFVRFKNIKKFVRYIYSCENYNIITIDLVITLAKRNKVEDKDLKIVFQELVNTAYNDIKSEPQLDEKDPLPNNNLKTTTLNDVGGSNLVILNEDNNHKLKKFNHFSKLLKDFDFEEVFLSLSPDTSRELYQIKDNLSVEHSNTIYRLAERIEELTGQKRKRDRWNLSLTIYSIVLTTLGAIVTFSQYFERLIKFFSY